MRDLDPAPLLAAVLRLHDRIRDAVVAACESSELEALSAVHGEDAAGDTIFAIDKVSEDVLVEGLEAVAGDHGPIRLVAEGLESVGLVLPRDASPEQVRWRVIVDPIDGTRGLMYQKRPAFILTGIAPELGPETGLQHVAAAALTEIPLVKSHLCDQFSAVRGSGLVGHRFNRLDGSLRPLRPRPSREPGLDQGFAQISRFFPGGRDLLAAIDDALVRELTGPARPGKAACFEDQYVCSGGQLYELLLGHDRFTADLRSLIQPLLKTRGDANGLCCHPYDLCAELVAREAGVVVCDPAGGPLTAPLWCQPDVSWCGYANARLHAAVEPVLQRLLRERALL